MMVGSLNLRKRRSTSFDSDGHKASEELDGGGLDELRGLDAITTVVIVSRRTDKELGFTGDYLEKPVDKTIPSRLAGVSPPRPRARR